MRNLNNIFGYAVVFVLITQFLIACGPSAEERAAMAKVEGDSIAAFEKGEASGYLEQPTAVEANAKYIKLIAKSYASEYTAMEIFLVGADTFVVVNGRGGSPVVLKK